MNVVNEKITKALENDKDLKLKIQNIVRSAVEKELVAANIIKSGEMHNPSGGCVSVLWTSVCTA